MKITFIIFLSVCCSSFHCNSQILNIEQFRLEKDTANAWFGSVGLGFSTKQQKVSVTTINGNSNVVFQSKKHAYMNINYLKFIRIANSELVSDGYTHWRINLLRRNL